MFAEDTGDVGTYTIGYFVTLQNYPDSVNRAENGNAFSFTVTESDCAAAIVTLNYTTPVDVVMGTGEKSLTIVAIDSIS